MERTRLDLDLLATFAEVHRSGSMSAAAHRLGISQPTVSERIQQLERQLGRALFTRSRTGAVPTPDADALAARVLGPVEALRSVWSDPPSSGATGTVRIGGASDVVAARLVPALAPLAADGLALRFTVGLAQDLLERLVADDLDVVVSSIRPESSRIEARGLIDEEFVLVGAPSVAASVDAELLARDPRAALRHLPLVVYDEQRSIVRRYWRSQFDERPDNRVSVVLPDLRGLLAAVVAGAGVTALPRYLAEPALAAGSVVLVHEAEVGPINTLWLAVPAGRVPDEPTLRVMRRLRDQAAGWDAF